MINMFFLSSYGGHWGIIEGKRVKVGMMQLAEQDTLRILRYSGTACYDRM